MSGGPTVGWAAERATKGASESDTEREGDDREELEMAASDGSRWLVKCKRGCLARSRASSIFLRTSLSPTKILNPTLSETSARSVAVFGPCSKGMESSTTELQAVDFSSSGLSQFAPRLRIVPLMSKITDAALWLSNMLLVPPLTSRLNFTGSLVSTGSSKADPGFKTALIGTPEEVKVCLRRLTRISKRKRRVSLRTSHLQRGMRTPTFVDSQPTIEGCHGKKLDCEDSSFHVPRLYDASSKIVNPVHELCPNSRFFDCVFGPFDRAWHTVGQETSRDGLGVKKVRVCGRIWIFDFL